jgi:hypothetical protein
MASAAPHAHQLDNRPEFLTCRRQSVVVAIAFGFRFDVHRARSLKLLETLRQGRP